MIHCKGDGINHAGMRDGIEKARKVLLLQVHFNIGWNLVELALDVSDDGLHYTVKLQVSKNGSTEFIDDGTDDLA